MPDNKVFKKVYVGREKVKSIFESRDWKARPDLQAAHNLALGVKGEAQIFENTDGEIFTFTPSMFSAALHKNEASFLAQCALVAKNRGKVSPNE